MRSSHAHDLRQALLFASVSLGLIAAVAAQTPRPHVVVIFADDMGWTDLSSDLPNLGNGSDYYRTPNIDRLASLGMSFTAGYSNAPNCAPTRAALISGQWAPRTGVYTVNGGNRGQSRFRQLDAAPNETVLASSFYTLPEMFRDAGYATGHFGKWHLGSATNTSPTGQGFDENVAGTGRGSISGGSSGHFARNDGSFNLPNCGPNGVSNQFMADRLTGDAISWMGQNVGRPFFCYLSHFSVHTPVQAPSADRAAFDGVPSGVRHDNQTYAGMLKNFDDGIGRVITFLETTPDPQRPGNFLIDNTVVVFTSDNGGLGGYGDAGIAGGQEITHQFPLRSGKGSLTEGGFRVPYIVRWDGVVDPGSQSSVPVQTFDLYPTFTAIADGSTPPSTVLDGVDLSPVLRGQAGTTGRSSLYWHFPGYLQASSSQGTWRATPTTVVRRGDWKLLYFYENQSFELYDLATDIGESNEMSAAQPGLVRSMALEMRDWLLSTNAPLPRNKSNGQEVPLPVPPGGALDNVTWSRLTGAAQPSATTGMALVSRDRDVFGFGGSQNGSPVAEAWTFTGAGGWTPSVSGGPAGRVGHGIAFDPSANRVVVYGGESPVSVFGDTWYYTDAVGWGFRPGGPGARVDMAMTTAPGAVGVVMFGGNSSLGVTFGDTWILDGATPGWVSVSTINAPSPRFGHGLAYDPVHDMVWLFGGFDSTGRALGDLWSFDGVDWTAVVPAGTAPDPRGYALVEWDLYRERLVVAFGAVTPSATTRLPDTFDFDGVEWLRRFPGATPLPRARVGAAFDPSADRVVLFGGTDGGADLSETWMFLTGSPALASTFGSGCLGSGGVPRLQSGSAPWIGSVMDLAIDSLPPGNSPCLLYLGLSRVLWRGLLLPIDLGPAGAPGCFLRTQPLFGVGLAAAAGEASLQLSVPSDPALVGSALYLQAISLDPIANGLGLTSSNGFQLQFGLR